MQLVYTYLIEFLIGGFIVAGVSFLAKHVNTKSAAVLYAIPIVFTLSAVFIRAGGGTKTLFEFTSNAIYTIAIMAIFVLLFWHLLRHMDFWRAMTISYVVFFVLVGLYLKFL